MSDVIQRLREARPDAAGPHDEVVESARAALMAEVTRGRPSRRWGRRRVLGLAAPALAAGVTAVAARAHPDGRERRAGRAAALVRVAEAAPRLLVDEPGWTITRHRPVQRRLRGDDARQGRPGAQLSTGCRRRSTSRRSTRESRSWTTSVRVRRPATMRGSFAVPERTSTSRSGVSGDYMIEAQGSAPDAEAFSAMLGLTARGGHRTLAQAMPERIKLRGDSFSKAIERSRGAPSALSQMSVFARPQTEADVAAETRCTTGWRLRSAAPALGRTDAFCTRDERAGGVAPAPLRPGRARQRSSTPGRPPKAGSATPGTRGPEGARPDFAAIGFRAAKVGIDPDELGVGAPGVLVGIVPDDVVAVSVRVDGVEYPAILGEQRLLLRATDTRVLVPINELDLAHVQRWKQGRATPDHGHPCSPGNRTAVADVPLSARRPQARERRAATRR